MARRPTWRGLLLVLIDCGDGPRLLANVMKTRRRAIPFGINGKTTYVARAVVRDYLKQKLKVN
jgi:hypothetical protein